jgi:hypothetical protein
MSLFGGAAQRRARLPSYGGFDSSDDFNPYGKSSRGSNGGAGGGGRTAALVVCVLLALGVGGLGWSVHSTRAKIAALRTHINVMDEELVYEKVRVRALRAGCGKGSRFCAVDRRRVMERRTARFSAGCSRRFSSRPLAST